MGAVEAWPRSNGFHGGRRGGGPATLTLRVTVTDSAGGSSTDEVVITVKAK